MSLAITIVTTANRTRRFFQTDPARISEIIESLKGGPHFFDDRMLVIVGELSTEGFSASLITRIELETEADWSTVLPPSWRLDLRALAPGELIGPGGIENGRLSADIDFFFQGGDTLAAWVENSQPELTAERVKRIAAFFEQKIIPYRLATRGIGIINPAVLTGVSLGAKITDPPAGAWFANEV